MLVTALLCADTSPNLGRLDYASLSQQTLLEMVFAGITKKENLSGSSTEFLDDLNGWKGIHSNENGEVLSIDTYSHPLVGSVSLEWLPATITEVMMSRCELSGTIDLRRLPDGLEYCALNNNKLSGSLVLEELPPALEELLLFSNEFTGSVNLTRLPEKILTVDLSYNQLSGALDLTALPPSLTYINLQNNTFSGETDFSKLSTKLLLSLNNNVNLSGKVKPQPHIGTENTKITFIRSEAFETEAAPPAFSW